MFWMKNKGHLYTPANPSLFYIKVGFKWVYVSRTCFSDSVMVRASASGAGGRGFNPGPGHTKDFKNGTSGYLAWRSAL